MPPTIHILVGAFSDPRTLIINDVFRNSRNRIHSGSLTSYLFDRACSCLHISAGWLTTDERTERRRAPGRFWSAWCYYLCYCTFGPGLVGTYLCCKYIRGRPANQLPGSTPQDKTPGCAAGWRGLPIKVPVRYLLPLLPPRFPPAAQDRHIAYKQAAKQVARCAAR